MLELDRQFPNSDYVEQVGFLDVVIAFEILPPLEKLGVRHLKYLPEEELLVDAMRKLSRQAGGGLIKLCVCPVGRNAEALETLEKIDTLVVDKTGTLTIGKPDLVAVKPADGIDETEFLAAVAGVEMGSEHPLAHAIVEGAKARGVSPAEATDLASTTGEVIFVDGGYHAIGMAQLENLAPVQS